MEEMIISKNVIEDFEKYCEKHGITGKQKDEKLKKLLAIIKKMSYEPGEAIGIVAAQSISEPATQMTMRSYTLASTKDRLSKITQGLPRLIEIFDARKTYEKHMKIYLTPEYNDKEKARTLANKIKSKKIMDIISCDSIDLINLRIEFELENEKDIEKIQKLLAKTKVELTHRGKTIYIKPKKTDIKTLRKIRNKLLKTHIEGVKNIEEVLVVKEDNEWIVQTIGTNLKKILKLEEIDVARTTTNDVQQVLEVLGVEAARNIILHESKMTMSEQGLDIDIRHMILLADIMTAAGDIKAIGRYGVSGAKASVLARANFEETKKHLVNAAISGEIDTLRGVIENVLVGQIVPVGTGMVELGIDVEKMRKAKGVKLD
ncbi:MAG: DNA-directed RNA polymerase subunit A'' [Candidatus Aenigmatarchaeota archaeon]